MTMTMTNPEHESWSRVKGRLRAEVGDDIYSSWFARMDLEGLDQDTVRLSVPTRFLKSWIQSHYVERVLACWQAEQTAIGRIELTVRSSVLRPLPPKPKADTAVPAVPQGVKPNGYARALLNGPVSAAHEALGGSPLDPRLTFESFVVGRANSLAQAAAKQVAACRRGEAVM